MIINKTILITGGSSYLGANLAAFLASKCNIITTVHSSPALVTPGINTISMDLLDPKEILTVVEQTNPHTIIHAAAITNQNFCKENPGLAQKVNATGTKYLAKSAKRINARFIYLSSDSVFDGLKGNYSEKEIPSPINVYGWTKLDGEQIVRATSQNHLILRIALLYGWSLTTSKCFVENLIESLSKGETVRPFLDEYRNPLHVLNLCEIIEELIIQDHITGTFNISGPLRVNRYEQTLLLADIFGFDRSLIEPISIDDIQIFKDNRPKDCSLNTEKLRSVIKTRIWTLEEGFKQMFETWKN